MPPGPRPQSSRSERDRDARSREPGAGAGTCCRPGSAGLAGGGPRTLPPRPHPRPSSPHPVTQRLSLGGGPLPQRQGWRELTWAHPHLMGDPGQTLRAGTAAPGTGPAGTVGVNGGHGHVSCRTHRLHAPGATHACARAHTAGRGSRRAHTHGWPARSGQQPCTECAGPPHLVQFGLDLDHICLHLIDGRPATGTGRPAVSLQPAAGTAVRRGCGLRATRSCGPLPAPSPSDRPGTESGRLSRHPGRRGPDRDPGPADSRDTQRLLRPQARGGPVRRDAPSGVRLLWP